MLRQWVAAKEQHPEALLLFRMGDFFELFFDDAKVAAQVLDLTLTARDKGDNPIPMAGVPHHAVDSYIARLVAQGHSVVMCDQIESPKEAKGLVARAITRLVTPGTQSDLEALDPAETRYLAAAVAVAIPPTSGAPAADGAAQTVALAFLDLLAGELPITLVPMDRAAEELLRVGAKEVLLAESLIGTLATPLRRRGVAIRAQGSLSQPAGAQAPAGPPLQAGLPIRAHERAALTAAAEEVWAWACHTQRRPLPHVAAPHLYRLQDALEMDEASRQNLELTCTQIGRTRRGSLLAHLDRTRTPMGARLLKRWLLAPLCHVDAIARRADGVAALVAAPAAVSTLQQLLAEVRDLERLAGRVALGRATPKDVLSLSHSLLQLEPVAAAVAGLPEAASLRLAAAWRRAPKLTRPARAWQEALVDAPPTQLGEGGIFRRGYQAPLDELIVLSEDAEAWLAQYTQRERQKSGLPGLKVRYNRVFGYNIELPRAQSAQAPKHYVRRQTLANAERYVTQELKDFEQRALRAQGDRRALEEALFVALVQQIAEVLPAVQQLARLVAQTDAAVALAVVATTHDYVRPTLVQTPELHLEGARHAVLEAALPIGERFVANDVTLAADAEQLTILTGPNMAGKSTVMRQAALCVVMAQMGGFVPAKAARLGLVDKLFVRVGAADDLGRGQSTFMVEMTETAAILRQATRQSLVLLDEIGRGTSTYDGLSIAWAVAEYLHDTLGCRTLFATHYHELTALTAHLPRAVARQMKVLEQHGKLVFLRQLGAGAAGRSYGIEVARLAALPESVLGRARAVLEALEGAAPKAAAGAGTRLPTARAPVLAQLRPRARAAPPPAPAATAVANACAEDIVAELSGLDLNQLTPLMALDRLAQLQRRARAGTGRAPQQDRPARRAGRLNRPSVRAQGAFLTDGFSSPDVPR